MPTQTQTGKAFEYAITKVLLEKINGKTKVNLIEDNAFKTAKECYDFFDIPDKEKYIKAASKAISHILQLEPCLINSSEINISIQYDQRGALGDPRDVIIVGNKDWEIGFSIKNNNDMSIKSPRLSSTVDFSKNWFNIPCNLEYTKTMNEIFNKLDEEKNSRKITLWSQLKDKDNYYGLILDAFLKEICFLIDKVPNIAQLLCQYVIGKYDFYMIMKFNDKLTIKAFNMFSSLNKSFESIRPQIKIAKVKFPSRIIEAKRISTNKVHVTFDEGWTISFRIHNGSSKIQSSVKLEICFIGLPPSVYVHNESW